MNWSTEMVPIHASVIEILFLQMFCMCRSRVRQKRSNGCNHSLTHSRGSVASR